MNTHTSAHKEPKNDPPDTPLGRIFDIQKFAIHDGPGIRTTVFLKGCPLECVWCHNPESQESAVEISLIPDKCIGCGYCFKACPQGGHVMEDGKRQFHRELCTGCGTCAAQCYARALEVIGKDMTVAAVLEEVLKDKPFYETSGGGMTVSGGEPMAQFAFTLALVRAARAAGLHVCLETSGFAAWAQYEQLLGAVDLFLYDFKESDPVRHREFTGVPPETILDNLRRLDERGAAVVLRCPIIPGYNARDEHFRAIAALANRLGHVREINLMPYHPLGDSKRDRLGKAGRLPDIGFPDETEVGRWLEIVTAHTRVPVKRG
jgi:glycyl-radical enzyme activating protein